MILWGPGVVRELPGTVAIREVALSKVVGRAVPFSCTTEFAWKFNPVALTVTASTPATAVVGDTLLRVGVGAGTVIDWGFEVPPPGAGLTAVMVRLPGDAKYDPGTVALTVVASLYVVARLVPLTCTAVAAVKPVPITVTTVLPLPGFTVAGERLVMAGTGRNIGESARLTIAPGRPVMLRRGYTFPFAVRLKTRR